MRRSLSCALLLSAMLALPGPRAAAQEPSLLADLNPNPGEPGAAGSNPRQLTALAGRVVFVTGGEDPADPEYRLWATDGTDGGTEVIAILCNLSFCREPRRLGQTSNLAFFLVATALDDPPLRIWRTDGTREGTFPVSPPFYGDGSFDVEATIAGQRLLFRACDDGTTASCALWSTDGSVAGTRKLFAEPRVFQVVSTGGRLVFTGFDATGFGLWVSDGTPGGTELVTREGVRFLTVSGSKVFFMAGNDDYPSNLWVSDGTRRGSRLVEKFGEPFHYLSPNTNFLKPVPGGVVFVGVALRRPGVDLWRSDGTRKGTRPLTALQGNPSLAQLREFQIAAVGDRVFFVAFGTAGPRLWVSRGTPQTTAPVTGCPGPGGCPALLPDTPLAVAGNRVVFVAKDTAHGTEPWTSDGTGAGTRLLRDLCPGPCGSDSNGFVAHKVANKDAVDFRSTWGNVTRLVRTDGKTSVILARIAPPPPPDPDVYNYVHPPLDLADLSGRTFFAGLDPLHGLQPWVTDGTRPGTRRIDTLEDGGASSNPRNFTVLGNQLLFTAVDGAEHALWRVSPSGVLSRLAGTGVPASEPGPAELTESGLYAFYVIGHGGQEELWRTDGTADGTVRLATFLDKTLSSLRDVGGRIRFLVASTTGEQPVFAFWESDGTPAGTVKRFDLPTDTVGVTDVAAVGADLYFLLHREGGAQVFRSDGTAAGTRMVFQLPCDCSLGPGSVRFLRFRGSVYFTAWGNSGLTLYRTDGTAAGTVQAIPTPGDPKFQGSEPQAPFEFQSEIYFFARNPDPSVLEPAWVLWKGNGNDAVLVKDVGFRYGDPVDPQFSAVLGGLLYFRAWDPEHGFELWKTDGTAAGTQLVADVEPGPFSSDPRSLVTSGGQVWFSALDRVHGRELWTSDGTAAGTRRVADLADGGASSSPEELTPFAGRLYFSADDQVVGREPWSLVLNP